MSKTAPPTAKEVERGLASNGFERQKNTSGTSHTKWVKREVVRGKKIKRVVTVDSPKAPFSDDLVKSMAHQAGMSKKQFLKLCTKQGAKEAKRGLLDWDAPSADTETEAE